MIDAIALIVLMIGICLILRSSSQGSDETISFESPNSPSGDEPQTTYGDLELQRYRNAYYSARQKRQWNIKLDSYSDEIRLGYGDCSSIARNLRPEQRLCLRRELKKPGDTHSVSVWLQSASGDVELGHLPRGCSQTIAAQIDRGARFTASVERIEIHGPLGQFVSIYVDLHRADELEAHQDPGDIESLERAR